MKAFSAEPRVFYYSRREALNHRRPGDIVVPTSDAWRYGFWTLQSVGEYVRCRYGTSRLPERRSAKC